MRSQAHRPRVRCQRQGHSEVFRRRLHLRQARHNRRILLEQGVFAILQARRRILQTDRALPPIPGIASAALPSPRSKPAISTSRPFSAAISCVSFSGKPNVSYSIKTSSPESRPVRCFRRSSITSDSRLMPLSSVRRKLSSSRWIVCKNHARAARGFRVEIAHLLDDHGGATSCIKRLLRTPGPSCRNESRAA